MWAGSWKDHPDTPYGLQWVKDLPLLGATFNVGDYYLPTWEHPLPNLRHAFWPGLGGSCPIKASPWLLTLLPSPRSGTFATFSPSRNGRQNESLKPFGPSSGLGRRILFGVVRSAAKIAGWFRGDQL